MSIMVFGVSVAIAYTLLIIHSVKIHGSKFTLQFFLGTIAFAIIKESYFFFNVKYYTLPNVKSPVIGLLLFSVGWSFAYYLGYEMARSIIKIKSESDCLNFMFLSGFLVIFICFAIETAAIHMEWWILNTDYWYINDNFAPYDLLVGWFLNSFFFYHCFFIATKKLDKFKIYTMGIYILYFVLIPVFESINMMPVFIAIFTIIFFSLDWRWGAFISISSFLTFVYQTYELRNILVITILLSFITVSWLYLHLTSDLDKDTIRRKKRKSKQKKGKFRVFWSKIQYSKMEYANLK